jgi:hypothetical protein
MLHKSWAKAAMYRSWQKRLCAGVWEEPSWVGPQIVGCVATINKVLGCATYIGHSFLQNILDLVLVGPAPRMVGQLARPAKAASCADRQG